MPIISWFYFHFLLASPQSSARVAGWKRIYGSSLLLNMWRHLSERAWNEVHSCRDCKTGLLQAGQSSEHRPALWFDVSAGVYWAVCVQPRRGHGNHRGRQKQQECGCHKWVHTLSAFSEAVSRGFNLSGSPDCSEASITQRAMAERTFAGGRWA